MKISEIDVQALIKKMLAIAKNRRYAAGMNGQWDDGGASDIEDQIAAFKAGLAGEVPKEWLEEAQKIKNEADPEWAEHQRLQAKFKE